MPEKGLQCNEAEPGDLPVFNNPFMTCDVRVGYMIAVSLLSIWCG